MARRLRSVDLDFLNTAPVRLVFAACPDGTFCALRPALGPLWDLVGEVTTP